MTEYSEIATNEFTRGNVGVMHSILARTRIRFNATVSRFTLIHELVFDISFTDKNHVNVNKSMTCVAGESLHSMLSGNGAQTKKYYHYGIACSFHNTRIVNDVNIGGKYSQRSMPQTFLHHSNFIH